MAGFTAELVTKVQQRFGTDERAQDIYEFTKEVALASWKNGIEAGKRKSAPPKRPAVVNGSALKSGRLTARA